MSEGVKGREVSFGMGTTGSSAFDPQTLPRGLAAFNGKAAVLLFQILSMTREQKQARLASEVDDPLVVWFALLGPEQRLEFLKAAERGLK